VRSRANSVAVAIGPLVGGLITSTFGWRWAFLVNVPVGIALVALATSAVKESKDPDASKLDLAGMLFFGSSLACLVWALIGGNAGGGSSRRTITKLAVAGILLVIYLVVELIQRRPMVDFGLFRKRTFLGSSFAMLALKLPRFRGHRTICVRGVHIGQDKRSLPI
jgi:MFS family permease